MTQQEDNGQDGSKAFKFDPDSLSRALISIPLLDKIDSLEDTDSRIDVIIDANLEHSNGREAARKHIMELVVRVAGSKALHRRKSEISQQYVFATLTAQQIRDVAQQDLKENRGADMSLGSAPTRAIYKIWLDHVISMRTNKTVRTVKADAARTAFGAMGHEIVWAVLDTGVDEKHPHFATHDTLSLREPLHHMDFTGNGDDQEDSNGRRLALIDKAGHGTHVAGIIAGEFAAGPAKRAIGVGKVAEKPGRISSKLQRYREDRVKEFDEQVLDEGSMSGMAPRAKILSIKVLGDDGDGKASNIIAALEYIQQLNGYGRRILVHGVNLSVGYSFEPAWFACGQSPVCVEVDRLVSSGVVVVASAGNTGYGFNQPVSAGPRAAGLDITINDPGNAELAITVGSTHRDMPHVYGVSYFSSKGPTGDGRLKPDLVAPGERILSCASGDVADAQPLLVKVKSKEFLYSRYVEDSGTSMAAPHVSGVIAAFLSIRREFIGRPLKVKEIFLSTATDLGRERYFQGYGLVDLMRAIQSV